MKKVILKNLFSNKNAQFFFRSLTTSKSSVKKVSVNVKQGTVLGLEKELPNGGQFYSFKGIPYAQPPIGKLRFMGPQPIDKFDGPIVDCSNERNIAYHKDPFSSEIVGSEDCLFLNIYTPKLKSENGNPLPVMVWIHGGAFLMGSGNSDYYYPLYLLQDEVIIVTMNYRLGMFGFLSLPSGGVPGNSGLRDQLEAIKWVKDNIHNFNGDSNNITLFGQSAGAAAIHLHVHSDLSNPYFHKAIMSSGTANMEWVIQNNPEYKARKLAELMGCKSKNDEEIVEFLLKTEDAIDIYRHLINVLTPDERRRGLPMPFKPVIENSSDGILKRSPLESAKLNNSINIPIMLGYNSSEGITMIFNALKKLEAYDKDLARLIPRNVNISPEDENCLKIADEIRKFYFKGEKIDKKQLIPLTDLMSDYHFGIEIHKTAELHSKYQHNSPLFFYRFSYEGELNMYKKIFQLTNIPGACHGDELFYLFQSINNDQPLDAGSSDEKMVKTLCKLWTNFAKYGNPTPKNDKNPLDFQWDPVMKTENDQKFSLDYLEIDKKCRMKVNPDGERIDFWRNIYRTWNEDLVKSKL